ncbi:MAG TPA: SpoIID/LytB domain-containing protein [Syntrophomonadaceae bacterium]|nr:SpoIID/LytB domain-containing protein [Syntrophomonadaceae bacterium]
MAKRFSVFIILGLMILTVVSLGGCQKQPAKKYIPPPGPVQQSPEVAKYKSEPTISLYRTATGKTEQIKLEEYIKGVVAAEIGPNYPMEALKAQAIVARTLTLALLEYENGTRAKHKTDASDSHTEFQAYDEKKVNDNISKAVDDTRGQVLTYQGKFVYALFHSLSKDKTASIEEGFPKLQSKAAYLVPVSTNGMKNAPVKYKNWTVKVPVSEIKNILGPKAGNLSDIKISKRGPSGRALTITAGQASIEAVDLREKIGFDRLFSTVISSIKVEGSNVVFMGDGWGHGCGMEQWGAFTMAQEGSNARQIVEHYFPGTMWTQLYQ